MKCPNCNFVCSDLRDLCPKCHIDLRPFKKDLGLPISNARASYQQLMSKATGSSADAAPAPSGFFGFVARIFSSPPESQTQMPSVSAEKPREPQAEQSPDRDSSAEDLLRESAPELPPTDREEDIEGSTEPIAVDETSPEPTSLEQPPPNDFVVLEAINEALAELPPDIGQSEPQSAPAPEPRAELTSSETAAPSAEIIFSDQVAAHAPTEPFPEQLPPIAESSDVSPLLASPEPEFEITAERAPAAPSIEIPSEPEAPSANAPDDTPRITETNLQTEALEGAALSQEQQAEPLSELDDCFAQALRELVETQAGSDLELSAENFLTLKDREDIHVLFELARDSISDPQSESRYVEHIHTSQETIIEPGEAIKQLEKLEKMVMTPVVTLKGHLGLGLSGKPVAPKVEPRAWTPPRVKRWRLVAAFIIDLAVISLLAAFGAAATIFSTSVDFNQVMLDPSSLSIFDGIDAAMFFGIYLILLSIAWPTITLVSLEGTAGLRLMGLEVRSLRGQRIGLAQGIVRAILTPVSATFFGWTPCLFNKPSLQELASRTVVVPRGSRASS